jgi:hypothetical protein
MRVPCSWEKRLSTCHLSARPALLFVCIAAIRTLAGYGFVARTAAAERQLRRARLGLASSLRVQAESTPPCGVVASCIIVHVFIPVSMARASWPTAGTAERSELQRIDPPLPLVLHVDAVTANSPIFLSAEVEDVRVLARGFAWPHGHA